MAYDLHLMLLQCLKSQELDGDETYLRLNGDIVWRWDKVGRPMHNEVEVEGHMDSYDFRTGKYRVKKGWEASDAYDTESFVFRGLTQPVILELWESDEGNPMRGDDDLLGSVSVSFEALGKGEHEVFFEENDARYRLTLRLAESESIS